ncbi:unnamed protein product, partial [Didymodactylos carnosus]
SVTSDKLIRSLGSENVKFENKNNKMTKNAAIIPLVASKITTTVNPHSDNIYVNRKKYDNSYLNDKPQQHTKRTIISKHLFRVNESKTFQKWIRETPV